MQKLQPSRGLSCAAQEGEMRKRVRWEFSLGLVPFLCLAVAIQAASHAQTAPAHAQPAAAKAAIAEATPAKPEAQEAEAKEPGDRGVNTGIKVHGHWVIEVKSPDGRVITHREFENMFEKATGGPAIATILGGTSLAGSFAVALPLPCSSGSSFCVFVETGGVSASLVDPPITGDVSSAFGGTIALICQGTSAGACTNTLNVSVTGGSITLQGSGAATTSGSIGGVESYLAVCANINESLTTCRQGSYVLQPLTGTTITPVPYSAGQTVSVTVTISFQ